MPHLQDHDAIHVPPAAVALMGGFLLTTLVVVAAVRWSGISIREPDAPSLQVAPLHFRDLPDGSIAVVDALNGQRVETVTGEAGFLRGALRVLSHERLRRGLGDAEPFELHRRQDGRLTLIDPRTGVRLDLESFGPQHAGSFARLMKKDTP